MCGTGSVTDHYPNDYRLTLQHPMLRDRHTYSKLQYFFINHIDDITDLRMYVSVLRFVFIAAVSLASSILY